MRKNVYLCKNVQVYENVYMCTNLFCMVVLSVECGVFVIECMRALACSWPLPATGVFCVGVLCVLCFSLYRVARFF